jgi:hypothetical protein
MEAETATSPAPSAKRTLVVDRFTGPPPPSIQPFGHKGEGGLTAGCVSP